MEGSKYVQGPLGLLGDITDRIVGDIRTIHGLTPVVPPTSSALPLVTSTAPLVTTSQPFHPSTTPVLTSTSPSTTLMVPTSTPGVTSTPTATSTLVPTTSVMPTTSLTSTTPVASTSVTPTTSVAPTSTPTVLCADAVSLTFSGTTGNPVGTQGPFLFPGWTYDSASNSNPPAYLQSILNQASSTQVINVTNADGILLCNIAASGTNTATTATFQGITLGGQAVTKTQALPAWTSYANVTFNSTWQPLSAIEIITSGAPATFTTELWEISYVLLGPGPP
ncbi:g5948 [Coccomyxa elongata]